MDTDHCIYIFVDKDGNKMILSHYIDDIICGSIKQSRVKEQAIQALESAMEDHGRGSSESFRGPELREEDGLTWEASCGPYIDKIAKRFKVDPKIQEMPMDAGFAVMPEANHTPTARRVPSPIHESYTACIVEVAKGTSAMIFTSTVEHLADR